MRGKRYPALRFISVLFKIFAVLSVLGGLLTVIGATSLGGSYGGYGGYGVASLISFPIIISCIMAAVFLWATSEGILVFLDIEENTRKTAEALSPNLEAMQANNMYQVAVGSGVLCTSCGAANAYDTRYCTTCGNTIGS